MPAFGDDDIRIFLAGLHKLLVHGLDGIQILVHHAVEAPAPVPYVSYYSPEYTDIGVTVDEDLYIHQISKLSVFKDQDAFDDDDLCRIYGYGFFGPVVYGIVIDGAFYGLSFTQRLKV